MVILVNGFEIKTCFLLAIIQTLTGRLQCEVIKRKANSGLILKLVICLVPLGIFNSV